MHKFSTIKGFIFLIFSTFYIQNVFAQNTIIDKNISILKKDIFKANDSFPELLKLLKENNLEPAVGKKYLVEYNDIFSVDFSDSSHLIVNNISLKYKSDWEFIHFTGTPPFFSGFYDRDIIAEHGDLSLILISEFFNKNLSVEENEKAGFQKLQKLITSNEEISNYIILDNFGLNQKAKETLFKNLNLKNKNIFYVNRSTFDKYFNEKAAYYIESELKFDEIHTIVNYIAAKYENDNIDKIYMLGFLPNKKNINEYNAYISTVTTFLNLKTQNPKIDFELILLNPENLKLEIEKILNTDIKNFEDASSVMVIRDISKININKLLIEGMNVSDAKNMIFASKSPIIVDFKLQNNLKEKTIPEDLDVPVLILGESNSKSNAPEVNSTMITNLSLLLQNFISKNFPN